MQFRLLSGVNKHSAQRTAPPPTLHAMETILVADETYTVSVSDLWMCSTSCGLSVVSMDFRVASRFSNSC